MYQQMFAFKLVFRLTALLLILSGCDTDVNHKVTSDHSLVSNPCRILPSAGHHLLNLEKFDLAADLYLESYEICEDPELLFQHGTALYLSGKKKSGLEKIKEAVIVADPEAAELMRTELEILSRPETGSN